jgi:hypothetical protein
MTRGRNDIVLMRMTEGGGCGACGWDLSQSETGFAIELVVEALFDDPALLEPLFVRRCGGCGAPYDWDEKVARQAELHTALDEMLRTPRLQPRDAAKRVRRRFGVEGICVDDSSAIAWPLRRLQT